MPIVRGVVRTFAYIFLLSFPLAAGDLMLEAGDYPAWAMFPKPDTGSTQQISSAFSGEEEQKAVHPASAAAQLVPLSRADKWKYYLKSTCRPTSVGSSLLLAGIKQAQGSVPEWGGGMEGYGRRLASSFGQKAISNSIRIGLNVLLREDPRYLPSGRKGYLNRTIYAVGQTFRARKDAGGTRIAFSRFAGTVGAACIAKQWYPESYHTASECLTSGITSIGLDTAKSVFSEFWPDLRKLLHR
jgi:hypothetical protein